MIRCVPHTMIKPSAALALKHGSMAAKAKRQLCLERINKPHGPCSCTPLIPFRGSVVISRLII